MSRISDVIKNKNKVDKQQQLRRREEIDSMKRVATFKARLHEDLKKVETLLESDEIDAVIITIPNEFLAAFGESIYSEDLAEYDITQVEGKPNEFEVRHKFLQI